MEGVRARTAAKWAMRRGARHRPLIQGFLQGKAVGVDALERTAKKEARERGGGRDLGAEDRGPRFEDVSLG